VSYGWGAIRSNVVDTLTVAGNLYFLAEDALGIMQVWQVKAEGIPVTITPSEVSISAFDISLDGRMISYVSDNQLWLYELGSEEATSLVATSAMIRTPRFSRDGERIAYSVDSSEENPDGGIWMISSSGEDNSLILRNGPAGDTAVSAPPFYRDPQFAPNINALLVKVSGSETTSLSIVDVNTLEVLQVGQYDDGFWLRDGRLIAWGTGIGIGDAQASDIVVLDPNTQAEAISLFSLPADVRVSALMEVSPNQLRLITRSSRFGPSPLTVLNVPVNGTAEKLLTMNALVQPVFSPDGSQIAGLTHPDGLFSLVYSQIGNSKILSFPSRVITILWR
jgi:Tol biopolymer transport system component